MHTGNKWFDLNKEEVEEMIRFNDSEPSSTINNALETIEFLEQSKKKLTPEEIKECHIAAAANIVAPDYLYDPYNSGYKIHHVELEPGFYVNRVHPSGGVVMNLHYTASLYYEVEQGIV